MNPYMSNTAASRMRLILAILYVRETLCGVYITTQESDHIGVLAMNQERFQQFKTCLLDRFQNKSFISILHAISKLRSFCLFAYTRRFFDLN